MLTDFNNKGVIITGGSRGIGKGIAKAFATYGAQVLIISRDKNTCDATIEELNQCGLHIFAFNADVSNEEQMQQAFLYAQQKLNNIDVVCANAGWYPNQLIENLSVEEWGQVMDVNLKGTFIALKVFLPGLKRAQYGRVIITSSITGPITGYKGWSHYAATKAGQLGFMRSAALELARYNITVNAILPGNILTDGLVDMGEDYLQKMSDSIPLKRLGSVADIANTALFLASKEAGYITAQTIIVDGGQIIPESLEAF